MSDPVTVVPTRWVRVRASVLDRLAAAAIGVVLAPVIAICGCLVRREDGPPSLVKLARVGRDGAHFDMWKLRSMRVDAADGLASGSVITSTVDDRITSVGRALRRRRLDELPQVWNVVRGEMALFGPRPETPAMVDAADPSWQAVLAVRPGITGPTQLVADLWEAAVLTDVDPQRRYREEVLPVKLAVDRWYVERASPALDVVVVWSMFQRFVLGRSVTAVDRVVRSECPEAGSIPTVAAGARPAAP